jgi:hypothetical protein
VRGPEGHLTKLTVKLWARTLFFFIRSSIRNALPLLPNFGARPHAVYRDYLGAVSRRSGAVFFARHLDYFLVTRSFNAIYLDWVPSNSFTVTRSSLPSTGTGKKHGTATLRYRSGQAPTAPNQTAGPLVAST